MQPSYIVPLALGQTGSVGDGEACDALEVVLVLDSTADEELNPAPETRTATFDPELISVPPGGLT